MDDTVPLWLAVLLFGLVGLILTTALFILPAKYEAKAYNQKYNTTYTTMDMIFARQVILDFVNGGKQQTQNYNINGAIPIKIEGQK